MRRSTALLALSLCCLLAAAGPSDAGAARVDETGRAALLAVGDPAPDWTLRDAEGRTHSLSQYRGRVVVLDFWATWCAPCSKVMPGLEKLHRKYRARGVTVFGLSTFESGDPVALMKKRNCTYGLLLKGEEIAPTYGVETLPVIFVVGADGRIVYSHAGAFHKNLDAVIEKHLKGE